MAVIQWLSTGCALHGLLITLCPPPSIPIYRNTHTPLNPQALMTGQLAVTSQMLNGRQSQKPLVDDFSSKKASL